MSSDIGKKRKTFKRPNSNSDKDDDDNIHINSKPSKKRVLEESNPSQVDQISSDQERVSKKSKKTQSRLESEESNSYANDKTIYIEGLPYTGTEDDVRNFFSSIGHIASIRLPIWHDSARLRGYGHVEFTDSKYADKALGLDGSYMGDRYIKIEKPLTPKAMQQAVVDKKSIVRPPGCRSVYIKNIPYTCTENDVIEAMKVCGQIKTVRLPIWGHTQQLKGFGYVDFKREDSAEIAVKKSGVLQIGGRPVIIDFETGAPKKGFKSASMVTSKPKKSS